MLLRVGFSFFYPMKSRKNEKKEDFKQLKIIKYNNLMP